MSFKADKYCIDKKKKSLTKCNSPCYHVQFSTLYWVKKFLDSEYNGPKERVAKYIYGDPEYKMVRNICPVDTHVYRVQKFNLSLKMLFSVPNLPASYTECQVNGGDRR